MAILLLTCRWPLLCWGININTRDFSRWQRRNKSLTPTFHNFPSQLTSNKRHGHLGCTSARHRRILSSWIPFHDGLVQFPFFRRVTCRRVSTLKKNRLTLSYTCGGRPCTYQWLANYPRTTCIMGGHAVGQVSSFPSLLFLFLAIEIFTHLVLR